VTQDPQHLDLDAIQRTALDYCEADMIPLGFLDKIRSLVARVRELEAERDQWQRSAKYAWDQRRFDEAQSEFPPDMTGVQTWQDE
jgi:hypothetical protein